MANLKLGVTIGGNIALHASNYTNYAPSLTGTGASGTWSISISGNAGTVTNGVYTNGSYANPSWISSLGWSKITSTPTTISGYGISDAYTQTQIQNFFSGTTAITGYSKSNWDAAYGWGNHALGGYLTSSSLTGYATQSYVTTQISNLVNGAPGVLDTLSELATALGNDASFSTTVTTALGNRLRVDTASQGLTATQQGYGRTNLGLGTAATSATGDFAAAVHTHTFASLTSKPTTISGYGITDAITTGNIGSQSVNYATTAGALTSMNISQFTNNSGYITSSGNAATATYATNATRLYATDSPYRYGDGSPYYLYMTYDGTRWLLRVSPGTPADVRVAYADVAASANGVAWTNVTARPTALSSFTNDLGNYGGFLTGITSGQVTTALGFTPATNTHDHDGRYVRSYTTTNDNIDSDWGQSFKTFDPIPSGTPPIQSPNLRTINIGENFGRRTQLAFNYATDQAWFRRNQDSTWYTWREFIHSGNIGSQSVSYATSAGSLSSMNISQFTNNSGYLTGITSGQVTTALGFTPYSSSNPNGYTSNTGTVTSVTGTGTVSGLTLTGTVTGSGNLTLGGTLSLTSGNVTGALGYTPYNSTNPNGYTSNTGTVTSVTGTGNISGLTLTGTVTGSGNITLGGTLVLTSSQVTSALGYTPANSSSSGISQATADSLYVNITGDTMTGPLKIVGSNYGQDLLAVDGIYGRLFTITDDFSDSIFSANTISGLPVIEAFSDYSVKIGTFNRFNIVTSGDSVAINSNTVDPRFPFYVGDRSTASTRYILSNPGMGFNLADGYAQFQLYGTSGAYIDFVYDANTDYNGRIMYSGGAFTLNSSTTIQGTVYTSSHGNSSQWNDKATHRAEGTNYVDYSRYVYNNGAYSGSGWVEPSDLGVRYANSAGSAGSVAWTNVTGRPTALSSFTNDSGYITSVAWTSVTGRPTALSSFTNDLGNYGGWITSSGSISGSAGSVAWTNVTGRPTALSSFTNDSGYITTPGNITRLWAASHPNDYYIVNNWTGSYWRLTTNHGSPVQVGYSDSTGSVAWTNVSSRPTALSQFSNDLGNYGGWLTTGGKAADSELIDGIDSSRIVYGGGSSKVSGHSDANAWRDSGFYENEGGGSNWPSATWYNSINVRHSNQGNYHGFQVAMSYYDNNLWFRSYQGSGSFQSWAYAISSANIGSQSVSYASRSGRANGNFYIDDNYGNTVVGVYSSYRFQGIYAMGDSYKLAADGTTTGSLYGLAWTHSNAGGQATYVSGHQMLVVVNGTTQTAISTDIWARGDITAYSDARVKTNVKVIDNAVEKVKAIRGVTFNRIDTENDTKRHAGVIAQEVLAVLPEVVSTTGDGMHSVAYGNMVGLLIEAVKEQQTQIEDLKAEVKKLRGE
jgi:hypothetical protein